MNIGKCSFVWWFVEQLHVLPLDLMTVELHTVEAETVRGVRVSVVGVCQVKVDATDPENPVQTNDEKLNRACQNFLGKNEVDVKATIQKTLEGHQRQILGTLTVEEVYKDKTSFSDAVRKHIVADLTGMGFHLVSYVVTKISDSNDYMTSLGATQTAIVKREAEEGTAKNTSEARIKVAKYESESDIEEAQRKADAFISTRKQQELEAEAERNLKITRAKGLRMIKEEEAKADAAFDLETAISNQAIVREQAKQKVEEAQVMLRVTDLEMEKEVKQKEGMSLARLEEEKNNAESIRVTAQAEAERIQIIGKAEADAVRAKLFAEADATRANLLAEAEGLEKRAEALKQYGEAAIVQSVIDRLPEIAEKVAAPLGAVEKMVFVSNDGGPTASKVTDDVNRIIASIPETVEALTGIDLKKALMKVSSNAGGALSGAAMGAALSVASNESA